MRKRLLVTLAATALAAIGCSAGAPVSPSPSGQASPSASASARPSSAPPAATSRPSPAPVPTFAPDADWRTALELTSASGGTDRGTFEAAGRYRLRYRCEGDGTLTIMVDGVERASTRCTQDAPDSLVVRRTRGTQSVEVVTRGDIAWLVLVELPEKD